MSVTFIGRLVASVLMICGIGSFGLMSVKCRDHFVIFGWNGKTKHFLDELQKEDHKRHIVIVANEDLLEFKDPHVHYVRG